MLNPKYLRAIVASAIHVLAALTLAASSASAQSLFTSQTPEFSQNVQTVLFPFNVYKKVVNPDVLDADAQWLKQHPDAHFWMTRARR